MTGPSDSEFDPLHDQPRNYHETHKGSSETRGNYSH